jgi:hypothetical protein
MSLFSEETLFYIFYSMPRDLLQAAASGELYVIFPLLLCDHTSGTKENGVTTRNTNCG